MRNPFKLSVTPLSEPFSAEFLNRHRLSQGTVQGALKKTLALDLVARGRDGALGLVDPLMAEWLRRMD